MIVFIIIEPFRLIIKMFYEIQCEQIAHIIIRPKEFKAHTTAIIKIQYKHLKNTLYTRSCSDVFSLIKHVFCGMKNLRLIVIGQQLVEDYILTALTALSTFASQVVVVSCGYDHSLFTEKFVRRVNTIGTNIIACFSTQIEDRDQLTPIKSKNMLIYPQLLPIGILHVTRLAPFQIENYVQDTFLYINMTIVYPFFKKEHPATRERKHVLKSLLTNGFSQSPRVSHEEMIFIMSKHLFCACPRGIGPDTYRFWEAISAGCIPVASDWKRLRFQYAGLLPAVWVSEHLFYSHSNWSNLLDVSFNVFNLFSINEFGDILFPSWLSVTRRSLRLAYRFVIWKRYSIHITRLLQSGHWMFTILKSFY